VADVNANINIDINASSALAQLRALESQISNFNNSVARSNAAAMQVQRGMVSSLQAQIEATGNFNTSIRTMSGNLDSLATAFDKGTLSSRQYFRYAASQMPGLTKSFRSLGVEQAQMAGLAEERVKRLQTRYVSLGKDINGMQRMLAIQPKTLAAGYATDIALAEQRQQLFNRALQQGTTGLVNWGKNTQWAGRQLMVGFTVPLTIAAGAAAKFFMDLDKSAIAFRRVYGEMDTSTAETQKNLQAIQQLGQEYTKYGLAVNDVIDIGARAAATGAQNEELLAATEQTLRLATLGQTDYQTALDATISFQTAFLLNSQELAETIDFLNAVENQTVLTLEDMARAVPRVAPVIKGLGGDVQDLAVFMTALREGGVSAEQGANALKSGLASLINPTARASETLKEMGINIKSIVETNRGDLMGTVMAFGQALNALSEFERQQALEATFGKYQYARLGALFRNIAKDGSQAARSMELAGMAVEDLAALSEKELAVVSESVTNKFLGAVERLKIAIAPIGEMFLRVMTPIIDVVSNIANKFNELPDTVKAVIAGIVGAIGLIAPAVLMGIGLIANGIGNGLKFILALRGGIRSLVGALTGSTQSFQYQSNAALDAAAAMGALDGSSGALTSSLLMQEGAVNSLIGAYGNLAGAARAAAASMPRAFPAPVMAGGARIVRRAMGGVIPGTGNTDSVPALLTPGEFVMTKEATQQFGPILQSMNAGTTQGFAKGGGVGGEFAHVGDYATMPIGELMRLLNTDEFAGSFSQAIKSRLSDVARTFGNDVAVNLYRTLGFKAAGNINRSLPEQKGGVTKEAFLKDWDERGVSRWSDSVRYAGLKMEDVGGDLTQLDNHMRTYIANLDESARVTDTTVKQAYEHSKRQFSAQTSVITEFDRLASTVKEVRVNLNKEQARARGLTVTPYTSSTGKQSSKSYVTTSSGSRIKIGGERFRGVTSPGISLSALLSSGAVMQRAQQMGMEATGAVATGAQTNSPSDATRAVGKDVGQGLVQGMNESASEVRAAGENMGRTATSGVADAAKQGQLELFDDALTPNLGQPEQMALFSDDDLIAANRDAVDARRKNNFAIRQNTDATQKHTLQVKESTTADSLNEAATRKNTNLQVTKTQAGATMRPSIATTGAFIPAGAMVDNESAALAAALADQEAETKNTTKQTKGLGDRVRGLSGKLFGASAAFTGLTIAGSFMGGQLGEVANSLMPVAFGMDAVAGLLPMMMNPVGITIAAFAAVGGGLWFLNNQMNDVRARAQDFADSLTMSAAEVSKVAEYFGNESLIQRQQVIDTAKQAGVMPKDIAAGMEFIGSEVGQEMAKQFTISLEREGGTQSAENFANKLASMMMQGAVDFSQAKQIAAGLAQQLGQPEISAQIIGYLERIVGPNGEDLTKNPLKIAAEITANERQIVNGLVAPTTDAINRAMDQDFGDMAKTALVSPLAGLVTQLGLDIPYVTDISKNLMSFLDEDFEKATESVHTYGKAVGNGLRNAYDNLNSAIIRNDEIIQNANKKDRPDLRAKAIREEAKLRQDIAKIQEDAEQSFGKLVQQNAALSKEALDGMQVSLKEMYQDPTMQMFLDNLFARTGGLDQQVQFDVLMSLQSGQLNPMAANSLFDLIGNDEQAATTLNMLVDTKGINDTNEFLIKLMQIGDEEIRKKLLIQYAAEGSPQDAAILAGFTPEAEQGLKSAAEQAREEYQTALAEYNTVGVDSQGRQTRGGRFRLLSEADAQAELERLRSYYDTANSDLAKFYADREAIMASGSRLLPGLENVPSQLYGPQDEVFAASAQTAADYESVLERLGSINVKPSIKLDGATTSEEDLRNVTDAFEQYLELPESVQKAINIDDVQANATMEEFDVNWKKMDGFKDVFKAIGVDASGANAVMAQFGVDWATFNNLPDIVKRMVMQYVTVYQTVQAGADWQLNNPSSYYSSGQATGAGMVYDETQASIDAATAPYRPGATGASTGATQPPGGAGGGGGGGGGAAEKSPAELVKEMIDDLKQQLKFLGDYKKKDGEVISGLADALRNAGAPEQLIADIISKGADGIKMAKELLKDKAKKLKEVTKLMFDVARLTLIEQNRAAVNNFRIMSTAQNALLGSGIDPSTAIDIASDPEQAAMISNSYKKIQDAQRKVDESRRRGKGVGAAKKELEKSKKEWDDLTKSIKNATAAQQQFNIDAGVRAEAQSQRKDLSIQGSALTRLMTQGLSFEQAKEFADDEMIAGAIVAAGRAADNAARRVAYLGKELAKTKRGTKEYNRLNNELKKAEKQAEITSKKYRALVADLKSLTKAQRENLVTNTIAEYKGLTTELGMQQNILQSLVDAGINYAQAIEIASDPQRALAFAAALEKGGEAWEKIVQEAQEYNRATASFSLATQVVDFQDKAAKEMLRPQIAAFVQGQASPFGGLISDYLMGLGSSELQLFFEGSEEFRKNIINAFLDSLSYAEKVKALFDQINAQQQYQSLLNRDKADAEKGSLDSLNESLEVQKDLLEIEQDKLKTVQENIDIIQEENDDYERGLELISRQEEKINETFDSRIEALDKVEQANSRIAQQQQNQLNLSQALAQGDIYAAAQAAQQIRQDNAAAAIENTRNALEKAREEQLSNLVSEVNGKLLTRDQIEKAIEGNNDRIYQLQEDQLEPLQDAIDKIQEQIDSIEKSKNAWQDYYDYLEKNAVDPFTGMKYSELAKIKDYYDRLLAANPLMDQEKLFRMALQQFVNAGGKIEDEVKLRSYFGVTPGQTTPTPGAQPGAPAPEQTAQPATGTAPATESELTNPNRPPSQKLPDGYMWEWNSKNKRWGFIQVPSGAFGDLTPEQMLDRTTPPPMSALPEGFRWFWNDNLKRWTFIKKYMGGQIVGDGSRDSVPTLTSPGEFVVRKAMVSKYGLPMFEKINQGSFEPSFNTPANISYNKINKPIEITSSPTMYNNNYSINVTANTNASAEEIANVAVTKIRQINNMQIRGSRG
jgi:TP901 family phage tail tape measure protein